MLEFMNNLHLEIDTSQLDLQYQFDFVSAAKTINKMLSLREIEIEGFGLQWPGVDAFST